MKKITSLIIALSIILSLISFSGIAESGDIIYEMSFEEGLEDWTYRSDSSKYLCKISTFCATNGSSSSLYILDNSFELAPGVDSPFIEITGGETYSAVVNSYLMSGGNVSLFLRYYDENKNELKDAASSKHGATGKWDDVYITKKAPENAKYIQVSLSAVKATTGKCYFDDFRIIKGTYKKAAVEGTIPEGEK